VPPFRLVDAFTDVPFAGNPAGVVLLPRGPVDAGWAQHLAAEIAASETAFLHPEDDDAWRLRWWTPSIEVALCGHATLATAHVLWEDGVVADDRPLAFTTRSGPLRAWREGDEIALALPSWPLEPHPRPASLDRALGGVMGRYLGRTPGDQPNDVVEVADAAEVRRLTPDLPAVEALGSSGLIVTAAAGDQAFVSRYFAPAVGVGEDPVTGSAHSTLGPLWAERLGRSTLTARQLSARGGRLRVEVEDDRVVVAGHAVTVVRGEVVGPWSPADRARAHAPPATRPRPGR
jgi:predicted PhzF superfamily epimerase YddE/YHI9